ncbi:MAG: 4-hydroxythreonine-4-phosphate dehydrogenase PdxA [Tannerella sp.]|jgi:4-hydroxythreonine-4-phosphate dehydrogenase|nr:4-hydroxythreonine-4-phosphate dehydrogenase PdxA [Tannerella sp.]
MEERLIKIGITQGDSNGIGYEVILKSFNDERMFELCTPILYGSPKLVAYYGKILESSEIASPAVHNITDAQKAVHEKLNIMRCIDDSVYAEPGKPTEASGKAALDSLEAACADLSRGVIDVLLTAPINKHNIQSEKFRFPGHTEYLEKKFNNGTYSSLMILLNESLRVALVTGHIPLADIKKHLTAGLIRSRLDLFDEALRQDFGIIRPRIAVLSLNPHAGDNGVIGDEEATIIKPAIDEATEDGILAFGPYPADGFFGAQTYRQFDGVLAMYHDQGLAPFKALAMDYGVNFTAGLPIIRTSPAHGTAYDIVGKNIANENSFRHALYAALDIYRNRKSYQEASLNPLRRQYVDRSGDRETLDLTPD